MLMVCPKCRKSFTGRTALGGGWQGTNKVVGCPQCGTFFTRAPYFDLLCVLLGLVDLLFAGPLMIYQALLQDSDRKLWNGLFALAVGLVLILTNRYLVRKNVRGVDPIYVPPWERTK